MDQHVNATYEIYSIYEFMIGSSTQHVNQTTGKNNDFGKLIETPMTCWLKHPRNLKHFWIDDIFKFEEFAPFLYMCRKFGDGLRSGSMFA